MSSSALVATGVRFPDSTIQTTAAVASSQFTFEDYTVTLSSSLTTSRGSNARIQAVNLDGTSEIIFFNANASVHAVVWNSSTRTFGTAVLVRTMNAPNPFNLGVVRVSATSVLACTLPDSQSTALQTVVLTVSGSTITVNTPVSTTLSASCTLMSQCPRLVAVGSSFVVCYTPGGQDVRYRAITVSGGTPTVGAELLVSGFTGNQQYAIHVISSTVLITLSIISSSLIVNPIFISGTTATLGSGVSLPTNSTLHVSAITGTGRIALAYNSGSSMALISMSGSTLVVDNRDGSFLSGGSWTPRMQVIGNRVFIMDAPFSSTNYLVMTDNGTGNPGLSSQVNAGTATGLTNVSIVGFTDAGLIYLAEISPFSAYAVLDISTGSPVLVARYSTSGNATTNPTCTFIQDMYRNPMGNFPNSNNGENYVAIYRTPTGKVAQGAANNSVFTFVLDGQGIMDASNTPSPFLSYNDGISQAVLWTINPATRDSYTSVIVRRAQLL